MSRRGEVLLHHSDRVSTYASVDYRSILQKHGIACSTSQTGNYYDNAAMESWFSTFEAELDETFESIGRGKDAARTRRSTTSRMFYNQRRRQSSIGYIAPAKRERLHSAALETPMAKAA